jgi:hypothetical protein
MISIRSVRRTTTVFAALAALAVAVPAFAQDISESHLKAARAALNSIKATDTYDAILPAAAFALREELIRKNPNLTEVIDQVVADQTIALAPRRADLEKEAALAYARVFTEEDLGVIATFYNSPTGQKLLSDGPIVTRQVTQAADIWQRGVTRDLAQAVGEKLQAQVGSGVDTNVSVPDQPLPTTDGAAPAEGSSN